jgi:hypothetical protein
MYKHSCESRFYCTYLLLHTQQAAFTHNKKLKLSCGRPYFLNTTEWGVESEEF